MRLLIAPTPLHVMTTVSVDQWLSIVKCHLWPSDTWLIQTLAIQIIFTFFCYYYSSDNFFTVNILVLTHFIIFFFNTVLRYRSIVDQEQTSSIRMVWCIDKWIIWYCPFSLRLSRHGWYSSSRTVTHRYSVSLFLFHLSAGTFHTSHGTRRRIPLLQHRWTSE